MHPQTPESIGIPSENPTFRLPLHGAVELHVDDAGEVSPEVQVQRFLEGNGPLFESVDTAWHGVRDSQKAYKNIVNGFRQNSTGTGTAGPSRSVRRHYERFVRDLLSPNNVFGQCKYEASLQYPKIIAKLDEAQPLERQNQAFVELLDARYRAHDRDLKEKVASQEIPSTLRSFISQTAQTQETMIIAHMYAQFRQGIALRSIGAFLENPAVVPALIQNIHTLTETEEALGGGRGYSSFSLPT